MKRVLLVVVIVLIGVAASIVVRRQSEAPATARTTPTPSGRATLTRVVINEAAHTLLYLPVYHAVEKGYFRDAGLDVQLVTGGTGTNSFAAMVSGEAAFSLADPMYVPISRQSGARTKVVAQVVGRIAVWGLTMNRSLPDMSKRNLRNRRISTHPRPMTAYTYTVKTLQDAELKPDEDVAIIQSKPGTEIAPLLAGDADYAVSVEPNVSTAVAQGARVVLSLPKVHGDQVLSALMTTEDYITQNPAAVAGVVRAVQRALVDIHANPAAARATAGKYFPQVPPSVLDSAVERLRAEAVIPTSVEISAESWNKALRVRIDAGDVKQSTPLEENCALDVMKKAASGA